MDHFTELLQAGITGFLSGFLACIPIGPINISIINEGTKKGFLYAFMIGLGALAMDLIYCSIAFAGFSGLFESRLMRATMELLSFMLLLYLGLKYLLAPTLPSTSKTAEVVEQRLHPHSAFMIGFIRVLGNPAVLLFWITISATLIAHEWIADEAQSKVACVAGILSGGLTWFLLLSFLVSKGRNRFSTQTLNRMSHFSGAALLAAAISLGIRLIKMLAHH